MQGSTSGNRFATSASSSIRDLPTTRGHLEAVAIASRASGRFEENTQPARIDELEFLEVNDEALCLRQLRSFERQLELGRAGDVELAVDSDHAGLVDVCDVDLEYR
jgi:hypothetical protein